MTMALRHRPRGLSSASPREVTILQLLDWAFQKEKIRIDFDQGANERPQGALKGYGMEHILMRQAELGCRVQGGERRSRTPTQTPWPTPWRSCPRALVAVAWRW